jgi:cytosine/adenosine deaminase-related metal-dependent hydrolase
MPGPKVDLSDLTLLPPLINAHDHLELNHYPRTKFREVYPNAHAWAEDVDARLKDEPFRSLRAAPLEDRLFIGGLRNLLCGALVVVQHNPAHKALFRRDFPVRVVRRYAWAHSLRFSTPDAIRRTVRNSRLWRLPFYIHIGEGIDAVAAQELPRLDALLDGDLSQVVLVHGVGVRHQDIVAYAPRARGLVICPTTNQYLLNAVPNARAWVEAGGRLALGSDSRLTAAGDLLDELRAAHSLYGELPYQPEAIAGARPDSEDLIVVRGDAPLHSARRADLALIMRGGVPLIGDPELMTRFTRTETTAATLDGQPKAIHIALARQIAACSLKEPGLELT